MGSSSPNTGENKKYLSCHHLVLSFVFKNVHFLGGKPTAQGVIPGAEVPGLDAIFFKHCDNSTGRRMNFGRPRWMCILRSPRCLQIIFSYFFFVSRYVSYFFLESLDKLGFFLGPGKKKPGVSPPWPAVRFPQDSIWFRWSFGNNLVAKEFTPKNLGKHIYRAVLSERSRLRPVILD